ncbi:MULTISPECIES: hypothetical protein [unclassified Nocardioides]|uniref:hypothetical protein n=1 Tax=unclassified Nocardioides TaxID=2615069 RepID=UPI00360C323F
MTALVRRGTLLLTAVAGLLAGLLVVPPAAEAGQVGVTIGIAGAGAVQVVEGSLEDGGSTRCASDNQDHNVTTWCARVRDSEAFEAWVWLRATPSPSPVGHWRFDRWDGCDQTRQREGFTECAVHSGAFSSDERSPVAVFRDTVAPTTTLSGKWSGTVPGHYTATFSTSEGRTECSVDGSSFAACTSPIANVYAEGDHVFTVRSVDPSGNIGAARQVAFVVVDTVVTGYPAYHSSTNRVEFTATTGNGTEFLCALDGAEWSQCATGSSATFVLEGLSDGPHSFAIAARKNGWYMDQFPPAYAFRVDTVAPAIAIRTREVLGRSARFTFDEPTGESMTCRLSGASAGAWEPCGSPMMYTDLAPGSHRFEVRGTDLAGNVQAVPASHTWVIEPLEDPKDPDPVTPAPRDTTAPETTLTGGPAQDSWSLTRTATFEVASTEAGGATCTLDSAPRSCAPGQLRLDGLSAGTHVLTVAATDAAGNADASPATRTWSVPRTAAEIPRARKWRLRTSPSAYGGAVLETRTRRAELRLRVTDARRVALVVSGARKHGTVAVYAGRRKVATVRLAGRKAVSQRLVALPALPTAFTGDLRVVVTTRGRPVRIEGLGATTR